MCLYTKQIKPKVAEKDIVVYKILDYNMGSPYYGLLYHLNRKITSDLQIYDSRRFLGTQLLNVEEGLHSFTKRIVAYLTQRYLNIYYKKSGITYSTYKAIIPKGSKYYIGLNNDIASDALIVKRKLWFNLF